jgi:4,5-DOPA dioxygenase extradiol
MPAIFVSDFGPFPALENDAYTAALAELGRTLPRPRAIVIMSGHWEARGPISVSAAARPGIVHDYSGFPPEFYQLAYPCPGDPDLARQIVQFLAAARIPAAADPKRPLDHGAWVPLSRMYPKADIPVVQLTTPETPEANLELGRVLAKELPKDVLLIGSGALSHNLRLIFAHGKDDAPDAWALEFDAWWVKSLTNGDTAALMDFRKSAPSADRAVPTLDHINPFFFSLGAAQGAPARFFHQSIRYGSGLMKILVFNPN